jgi:creatinine amidohydrolase
MGCNTVISSGQEGLFAEAEMHEEVRYHMLRPREIVARRKACPVAYVPIGTIEWHGVHNPLGADTLQCEGVAIACARKLGGLVFPPLYYGESRLEALMEAVARDREEIARQMELPPENFAGSRQPFSATEQVINYHKLLLHVLAEVETLGFKVGVLAAGHYPLVDHCRSAVLMFNQREYSKYQGMLAWAFVDYLLVSDKYEVAGDHAGGWETSHVLALHPETVDLSLLPPKGQKLIGAGGKMAPQDSTAEFGRQTMEAAAEVACHEIRHRLEHPEMYRGHGLSLREGLWKKDAKPTGGAYEGREIKA